MITYGELSERANRIAVEKGWYEMVHGEPVSRDLTSLFCLFHSEISEILEAYRDSEHKLGEIWFNGTKPEGIRTEIADLFIRIADAAYMEGWFGPDFEKKSYLFDVSRFGTFTTKFSTRSDFYYSVMPYGLSKFEDAFFGLFRSDEPLPTLEKMVFASHSILTHSRQIQEGLKLLLSIWSYYCHERGWDLHEAIETKMAYNTTRPFRHGNKRL